MIDFWMIICSPFSSNIYDHKVFRGCGTEQTVTGAFRPTIMCMKQCRSKLSLLPLLNLKKLVFVIFFIKTEDFLRSFYMN